MFAANLGASLGAAPTWAFDPNKVGSGIVLSNNNRTATATSGGGTFASVLGDYAITSGGKVMVSLTLDVWCGRAGYDGLGFASSSFTLSDYLGHYSDSFGAYDDGSFYLSDSAEGGAGSMFQAAGSVIDMCVDNANLLFWFRVNGGYWNGAAGNDPSTATGGKSFTSLGTLYPGATPFYNVTTATGGRFTINGTATYGVPSGFTFVG